MEQTEHLVQKLFYRTLVTDGAQEPAAFLGREMKTAGADMDAIRFAQGEVYFHYHDLESAVFKWEQVEGDLSGWAWKNIGDVYYDQQDHDRALETFRSVRTDEPVLQIELALQLLSVHAEKQEMGEVYRYLEEALAVDPDYPGVTDLAQTLYEDNKDWQKAVDLAVTEALRTESRVWFETLVRYIRESRVEEFPPEYFQDPAAQLAEIYPDLFREMMAELTADFRRRDQVLEWTAVFNSVFTAVAKEPGPQWETMAALHHDLYLELVSGRFLEPDIAPVLPDLMRNWELLSEGSHRNMAGAAQSAWNETFPEYETMEPASVQDGSGAAAAAEELLLLFESILTWMRGEKLLDREAEEAAASDIEDAPELLPVLRGEPMSFDRVQWLTMVRSNEIKAVRSAEVLSNAVQKQLQRLLEQQSTVEEGLAQSIDFYEEMLSRFKGVRASLLDKRTERRDAVLDTYLQMKQMQKEQFEQAVPDILRAAEDVLEDEEKSAKYLHDDLNAAMNTRLRAYIDEELFPVFKRSIQQWLKHTEEDFSNEAAELSELETNLNASADEEVLSLKLDQSILSDWRRDLNRMLNRTELTDENIMSRFEPKQMLLRNVGKWFGDMQQSRSFLVQQYRRYLENDDFHETAEALSYKLFFEFDLFERAVKADVDTVYTELIEHLDDVILTYERYLEETKEELHLLQEHPERFYDPIKLFDMRHRQCSQMLSYAQRQ
ncbi:tetratricopeptide repeat protein [Alkalicoccus urumqiensis]|uniref:Uncharacterized protein n=1 Tax=Alkalicoccus urumqiensis TaxID=1548213 RepID=A0A2P6MGM9_ALKUR|nr:hypothetical protein [Alkalicoccus urumqiensis]PRO65434.1 hypothetical protein C6I21_09755 [Alkalicoccus urumqiensis]